jgi:hypothetical protein
VTDLAAANEQIAAEMAACYADPLRHVLVSYPWGQGQLKGRPGPQDWQRDLLIEVGNEVKARGFDGTAPVAPIQFSTSSGHGIGKSAIVAWLIRWIMDTRPFAKGVVTANTGEQLRTKTWSELAKWHGMGLTKHWYTLNSGAGSLNMYHTEYRETWRVDALTSREENSEAFAGLHAANSTPFYIFDEACHDDQTEVMTRRGWILFRDVTPEDELLTMGPDGRAYYDRPSALHVSPYNGPMLVREGRGANFSITPNHRMAYYSRKQPDILQFSGAGEMSWSNKRSPRVINWIGHRQDWFTIPAHRSARKCYPERKVPMEAFLRVLAWFLTEGSIQRQAGAPGTVSISQHEVNADNRSDIVEALSAIGCRPKQTWQSIYTYDPALAAYLDTLGQGFQDKAVPTFVFDLPSDQIDLFLRTAVLGDGYDKGPKRSILYTGSKRLADDYQRLILLRGHNSTLSRRSISGQRKWIKDHWAISSVDGYVVSWAKNKSMLDLQKAKPKQVHYEGNVYCATISGGVLLTRRGGVALWSGNSAVPNRIYEVREGGLTDGEPMTFDFGNPTRKSGRFYENMVGRFRENYIRRFIDSRDVEQTNKELFDQWAKDYGEDSDFFKVRVRGQFPSAGSLQFISTADVEACIGREVYVGPSEPLVMGVDVARFGDDSSVIYMRQGRDAETPGIHIYKQVDSMTLAAEVSRLANDKRPDAILVDGGGVGGPVVDRLRQLGHDVIEINFGSKATQKGHANMRAQMWANLRTAMQDGIRLPDNEDLKTDLTGVEYGYNIRNEIQLERKEDMKKRGMSSPDIADALALTYALPVSQTVRAGYGGADYAQSTHEYEPF